MTIASQQVTDLRTPAFWAHDASLWFTVTEAQFRNSGITTDETKTNIVLRALDHKQTIAIADVLKEATSGNMYEPLKKALIDRFTMSQQRRTRQLLEGEDIGDRTPTQFLRDMRRIGGTAAADEILAAMLMKQLSPSVQAVLSMMNYTSADQLAAAADRAYELYKPNVCMTVQTTTPTPAGDDVQCRLDALEKQLHEVQMELNRLRRRRSRTPAHNRMPARSMNGATIAADFCYYHEKFGDRATRCRAPCKYTSGNGAPSQ